MSQLSWFRFDVGLPRNPKILGLLEHKDGYPAVWLFTCCLAYSAEHGLDGWVPASAMATFGGCYAPRYATVTSQMLVNRGLLDPQPGGFVIHDWMDYQATSRDAQARSARAREAAKARWNGHEARSPAERQRAYRERKAGRNHPDTPGEWLCYVMLQCNVAL